MQKIIVEGGHRLSGELRLQGAKNSILPLSAAALICSDEGSSVFRNCPDIADVYSCCRIITALGGKARLESGTLTVDASRITDSSIPDELMREMRSSIIFLGAILARTGKCSLSFPGGCQLGARPVDMHIAALRKMGVEVREEFGRLDCFVKKELLGARHSLSFPSVGTTENIMLAAVTARGETVISNAAREPEITDLAGYLNSCGAKIKGAGESTVVIDGVRRLHSCEYTAMPDRIAAATYLSAAASTGGEIILTHSRPSDLAAVLPLFEQMGCYVASFGSNVYLSARLPIKPTDLVRTMPYPGFPTDMQPIVMAPLCKSTGSTVFVENIFENRYNHIPELQRMGADIRVEGKVCVVKGVRCLYGAEVDAPDLRGGAALVLAGLSAVGTTTVSNARYIDRGYDSIEAALSSIGAKISRTSVS